MKIMMGVLATISCAAIAASCDRSAMKNGSPGGPPVSSAIAAAPPTNEPPRAAESAPSPSGSEAVHEGTIKGVISDSMCGKDHGAMGEAGKDPAACTKKCVQAGAKYVLVDDTGKVYELSDQKKPEMFAGKRVAITGHIYPKRIHVHSLAAE